MIEAKVTCMAGQIQINDLSLKLVKGMTVYMPEARARASHDLQIAWRAKGVEIQYVQRTRQVREPSPEPSPVHNPVFPQPSKMGFVPVKDEDEEVVYNPDDLAARVAAALLGSVPAIVRQEVHKALAGMREGLVQDLRREVTEHLVPEVRKVVHDEMQGMQVTMEVPASKLRPSSSTPQPGSVDDDVPVFIPSRIRVEGMHSEIEVSSEQGDDVGLSSAAAALKAARKAAQTE